MHHPAWGSASVCSIFSAVCNFFLYTRVLLSLTFGGVLCPHAPIDGEALPMIRERATKFSPKVFAPDAKIGSLVPSDGRCGRPYAPPPIWKNLDAYLFC